MRLYHKRGKNPFSLWFAGYSLHEVLFLLFDFYILVSKPLSCSCCYKALASYLNGYFSVSSSDTNLTFNNRIIE